MEEYQRIEEQIRELRKQMVDLLKSQGPEEASDYDLIDQDGNSVKLSQLFGDKQDLIVVHNMGRNCPYCTLWADGFNGLTDHFQNRAGFVVVSPDEPHMQKEFAQSRGWRFKMVSAAGSSFTKDMGFEVDGDYWPGFSTFRLEEGQISRIARDYFGPGDFYCSAWHMFDLLKNGAGEWGPRVEYAR